MKPERALRPPAVRLGLKKSAYSPPAAPSGMRAAHAVAGRQIGGDGVVLEEAAAGGFADLGLGPVQFAVQDQDGACLL